MARLADQCQMWKWKTYPDDEPEDANSIINHAKEFISSCEVIVADNVADYWFARKEDCHWEKDFPCIAPPFPRFFVEFKIPNGWTLGNTFRSVGFATQAWDMTCEPDKRQFLRNALGKLPIRESDVRWVFRSFVIAASKRLGTVSVFFRQAYFSFVGESGAMLSPPHVRIGDRDLDALEEEITAAFYVLGLTISLMHCKNIVAEKVAPTDEEKERHAKGGNKLPLCKYRVLHIEPMKEVLRTEGNVEANGIKKALHICRGHFADYTEKGLFGKYFGRFWVPQHVRGASSRGVVVKDYAISSKE